jgi:hypothetical protein
MLVVKPVGRRKGLVRPRNVVRRRSHGRSLHRAAHRRSPIGSRMSLLRSSIRTGPAAMVISLSLREWRNWQTRWLQVPVLARVWGFKSPLAHARAVCENSAHQRKVTGNPGDLSSFPGSGSRTASSIGPAGCRCDGRFSIECRAFLVVQVARFALPSACLPTMQLGKTHLTSAV